MDGKILSLIVVALIVVAALYVVYSRRSVTNGTPYSVTSMNYNLNGNDNFIVYTSTPVPVTSIGSRVTFYNMKSIPPQQAGSVGEKIIQDNLTGFTTTIQAVSPSNSGQTAVQLVDTPSQFSQFSGGVGVTTSGTMQVA